MPKLDLETVPTHKGTGYPAEFREIRKTGCGSVWATRLD